MRYSDRMLFRLRSLILALSVAPVAAGAAVVGTPERAAQFTASALLKRSPNADLSGQWADDGAYWFVDKSGSSPTLVLGRPGTAGSIRLLINSLQMWDRSSAVTVDDLASDLSHIISFDGHNLDVVLPGRQVDCVVEVHMCSTVGPTGDFGSVRSPDGKLVAEAHDGGLILRSQTSALTVPAEQPDTSWARASGANNAAIADQRHRTTPTVGVWSPDSSTLLTFVMDEHRVRTLGLLQSAPPGGGMPQTYAYHYPMPCDPELPTYAFRLVSRSGRVTRVALEPQPNSFLDPITIKEAWWAADSKRAYLILYDRTYTHAQLYEINVTTGSVRLLHVEAADYPINPTYGFGWSDVRVHGQNIIWPSQVGGKNSLYLFNSKGDLVRQLTPQNQFVRRLLWVDFDRRTLYYTANGGEPGDPYFRYVYRVGLDGGRPSLLTPELADHDAAVSPDGSQILDSYSRIDLPTTLVQRRVDGTIARVLARADDAQLRDLGWRPPHTFTVKARDGRTDVYGVMFFPSNYNPGKHYPLLELSYPGPQAATVPRRFEEVIGTRVSAAPSLAELGFLVMEIDGMGKPFRSLRFSEVGWHHMGDAGIPDSLTAIDQLARRYPIDRARVGVYGNSAGGYASTRALLTHPETYRAAFSMAGDHDLGLYAATWFERYQGGCPASGPPSPSLFSNVSNSILADKLRGKLLIGYGEVDDNVNPLNSIHMIEALRKQRKSFEMLMVPGASHNAIDDDMALRALWDFFIRNVRDVPRTYSSQ